MSMRETSERRAASRMDDLGPRGRGAVPRRAHHAEPSDPPPVIHTYGEVASATILTREKLARSAMSTAASTQTPLPPGTVPCRGCGVPVDPEQPRRAPPRRYCTTCAGPGPTSARWRARHPEYAAAQRVQHPPTRCPACSLTFRPRRVGGRFCCHRCSDAMREHGRRSPANAARHRARHHEESTE
jgi:hypothetical protein